MRRWRNLSGPDRFRLYTRLILQSVVVGIVAVLLVSGSSTWLVVGIVIAGLGAAAGLEAQPELAIRANDQQRRFAWWFAVAVMSGMWLAAAAVAAFTPHGRVSGASSICVLVVMMASIAVLPFVRYRWFLLAAVVAVTALAVEVSPVWRWAVLLATCAALIWTTRTTVWGLRVLTELEESKDVAAELQVTQERLRFARDMHDVVGRGFSAIAVKSELAATLSRAGAADRAATEMDEVKDLAVTSMGEMRAVVRGYRSVALSDEVAGATALLSAAGCQLTVTGSPALVPTRFHEVAAWVVREGTTNIVRHSTAAHAVLTLGPVGLDLTNDGVPGGAPGHRSGLAGLAERVELVGAHLRTDVGDDGFQLSVSWEER